MTAPGTRAVVPSVGGADPAGALACFAPCPRGLEPALQVELQALGARALRAAGGGVAFESDLEVAYRVNLHSRIASRVLMRVGGRRYRDDDDLYRLAASLEWERTIDRRETLRVDVTAIRSPLRSLNFATLRVKDGIVDRLRDATGERPSIDTRHPGTRVFAFLEDREATLYLDLSGEPLFKRGWRSGAEDKGEAPLKENLAAGLLALAGWTPELALYDPFCGSGTIVIEAAQIAAGIAPGLSRSFGFERLPGFDAALWNGMRAQAVRQAQAGAARLGGVRIAASDLDREAIAQVRRNAQRAGLPEGAIGLRQADAARCEPPFDAPGLIVTNPPYGERVQFDAPLRGRDSDPTAAQRAFGARLRERFAGWSAWILSSDRALPGQLGLREKRKVPLFNGPLECRLFAFDLGAPTPRRAAGGDPARDPGPG
jgi:putative N6-adenine-specific DNA methylase